MANTIKGITIELDGNTSKFQKSLNAANKAVKSTQKELREVTKLLKYDPKNVELLKQKQELLNKTVDETKKKLDVEKAGLAALAKEPATKEVTDQMERLKTQIAEDEEALAKAKKELKDFGSVGKQQVQAVNKEWEEAGKKIEEVGGKIQSAGKELTAKVTAPIVAAGTATLAAFSEVDEGYDTVIKKTGAAGEAAQEMYDIVDQLATTIPTDFATAGEAVGEVNTRFGLTGDALYDLSEQFIKFAELNDTDVTSSVDSVQKALEAFGLGAEDAGAYLDALNKAAQDSGIGVDTLTQLTINNSEALSQMGLSLGDSTALMAQLEKSGVPVETVMGGLSKALKKATDDGVPLNEALADLQKTIGESEDDTEGLAKAYELFGKQGDKVFKAVKDGAINFEELSDVAADSAGSVSSTFEETLDPIDEWQMTLNELKLAAAEVGAVVGQVLQPILERIGEVARSLKERWEEMSPQTQEMIIKAAGIAAVIGPIVAIVGSIVTGIGHMIVAVGAIAGVLGVAASTVGIVIAALAALGVAIGYCIFHWDEIKAKVSEVAGNISTYVSNLKDNASAKFEEMKQAIAQKIDSVKTDMSSKWNQIKSDAYDKVTGMKNDVVNKFIEMKNKIKEKLDAIKGFFKGLVLKIPTPSLPKLPHFSLETSTKTVLGQEITYPTGFGVKWYAKAMRQPYVFTQPTVIQTPYGAIGGGDAGKEVMYGHESLMQDIATATAANNEAMINGMYAAMSAALQEADLTVQIGNREFRRAVMEAGVV